MKTKIYSKQKLILLLKAWAKENGKTPNKRLFCEDVNMPSVMAFRSHFGSWGNALKAAGFTPTKFIPVGARKGIKNKKHKRVISAGYIHLYMPKHIEAMKNGYVREHRMIISDILGRKLQRNEEVHHVNGIKNDNRPENLQLLTKHIHTSITHKNRKKNNIHNSKPCKFKDCQTLTRSKYGLCTRHYRLQWNRVKSEIIGNIHQHPHLLK